MARRKSVEILWICCGKPASKQQTMLEKWFPYRKLLKEGFLFWDTFKTFNFNNNVRTKIYPFFSFYTENCYDFWNKKWLLSWKIFIVGCQKLKWDLVKIKAPLWTNMSLAPSMGTHQAACLCKPLRLPHSSSADERYRKIRLAVQYMPYYSRAYLKNIKRMESIL